MAGKICSNKRTEKSKSSFGIKTSWVPSSKYRQLLNSVENMEDGLFALDRKWRFSYINKSAAKIFGQSEKQILGQHYGQIFPTYLTTDFFPKYQKALKTKKTQVFEAYSQTLKHWFLVHAYPTDNGLTVYFQNISFQKRMAEELAEREQHRELLFGGVSHELKNLLTSAKAYLQILNRRLEQTQDRESLDYVKKIDSRLTNLSLMLVDFIDLIRIRSNRLSLRKQLTDISQLIAQTVEEIQALSSTHRILVNIPTSIRLSLDHDRIKQVLINLIDNAIKYSPKANRIKIKALKQKGFLLISVQDFGQGIAKQYLPKIFDPFYRANWERQKKIGGLGLGLFISSELIGFHGGKIIVKSQKGKGSTFTILLPLDQSRK